MVKLNNLLHRKTQEPSAAEKAKSTSGETKKSAWKKAVEDDASQLSDLSHSSSDDNEVDDELREHVGSTRSNGESSQQFEKKLRVKHSKGCKSMSLGDYATALEEFESILSELLTRYGERHERVGAALHNVAIANLRAGSLDDAMDAIEEAIKIRSRALGRSHPRVTDSLVELGIILLSMEEHDDSLKVFERALKLRKEERDDMFASDDIDESNLKIAKVLNNIGCVKFEKGELAEAQTAFQEAIQLQRGVFRNWYTFVCGVDMNSPGVLTMASTMCNSGYVEIEQNHFIEATGIFEESLQIQRKMLGASNKLVHSSLDNLGYAYVMLNNYEKAVKVYEELWSAQTGGAGGAAATSTEQVDEKIETLRKLVACYARMEKWQKCFEKLEPLEDLYREVDDDSQELYDTRRLMGEVNYQLLKLPSLSDATNKTLGCAVCMGPEEEEIHLDAWVVEKPENTSKMSGHRVTHA